MVLDSFATNYIGSPSPALIRIQIARLSFPLISDAKLINKMIQTKLFRTLSPNNFILPCYKCLHFKHLRILKPPLSDDLTTLTKPSNNTRFSLKMAPARGATCSLPRFKYHRTRFQVPSICGAISLIFHPPHAGTATQQHSNISKNQLYENSLH